MITLLTSDLCYCIYASLSISSTDGSSTTSLPAEVPSVFSSVSSSLAVSSSSDGVVTCIGNFVVVVVGRVVDDIVELAITGTISHRLPLKPVGHSHLNNPSSFVNDVHLPPF